MKEEKQQLWIILLVVFIGFVGTSIAYPILPPLFLHSAHDSIIPETWQIDTRSIFLGVTLAAYPLGQFIGSPIVGGYSDYYGRKKTLILTLIGSAVGYLLSALALQYKWLWVLLLSRFITGLMEGNLAIVRAMAVELVSISKFKSLGKINGVSAIGYVIGPILGGVLSDKNLISWFSFALPFYLAMGFSLIAGLLAAFSLTENKNSRLYSYTISWEKFNFVKQFRMLFKKNVSLKYLLIVSTIFTFSVDMFYDFGPVYLTGLWHITPAGIAIYNLCLCLSLAIGAGWLPHLFSLYFSIERVLIMSMLITAILFGLMVVFPSPILAFIYFTLIGLSISTATTNMTISVSNSADPMIQGEALGAQLSMRMLGNAIICLTGGFLILSSVTLPLTICCLTVLIAIFSYFYLHSA